MSGKRTRALRKEARKVYTYMETSGKKLVSFTTMFRRVKRAYTRGQERFV